MTDAPTSPAASRTRLWIWLTPLLLVGACFWGVFFWAIREAVPHFGVELVYRPQVPEARKQELLDAVRRRMQAIDPRNGARFDGELLVVKLPGALEETADRAKSVLRVQGELHLSKVAPVPVQQQFNQDQRVPEGYKVVANPDRPRGGEYEAYGARILVRKQPVVEGRHMVEAEPRQELAAGGTRWVTAFEMNAEGARLFDEAAAELYEMRPPGLLAILLDGELKSCPAIQSPRFKGRGQISGAKSAEDARSLAIILRSGVLPVRLGDPEAERKYGDKK
jgi:preprotein translocase subunit SecD